MASPKVGAKYHEWVTEGEREGAWIKLTWDRPIRAAKVVLYDRISCKNQVTAGVLGFSDGSKITVGRLDNKGSPNVFEFEPKTVTEMYFNVTQVSYSTEEAGLAEIMVYELESEPGCPKEEPIDTNDQETNTNKPAKDDNKDKGKQDNTAPPKKEKEEEKEIKTKEGKPAAEQKEQTNNRAQEKESQKEVPGSGFLIALFVVAALVALFVVLLKKNTVAPRNSNPIVRAVFYRPHTHEF